MVETDLKDALANVSVVILTMNQKTRTLNCLESLFASDEEGFNVIIWDNGSEDGTVEAVREQFPNVLAHLHPENLGVASGRNAGAKLAMERFSPEYLLFLDNDMLFAPGFVSALLQPFLADQKVGQAQAKLLFMDDRERLNDGGGAKIDFVRWQVTPVGYMEVDRGQHDQVKPCISCGGAMMVRTQVFREMGGFDIVFDPYGPEDLDFSLRMQAAGYTALFVPQAVAYHEVSHSYGGDYNEVYAQHKARQWFLFMKRHATSWQKAGFYLFGAPSMAVKMVVREGRKGNLAAVRGILRGALGYFRKKSSTE